MPVLPVSLNQLKFYHMRIAFYITQLFGELL